MVRLVHTGQGYMPRSHSTAKMDGTTLADRMDALLALAPSITVAVNVASDALVDAAVLRLVRLDGRGSDRTDARLSQNNRNRPMVVETKIHVWRVLIS